MARGLPARLACHLHPSKLARRFPPRAARPASAATGRGPAPGRRRSPRAAACAAAARPSPSVRAASSSCSAPSSARSFSSGHTTARSVEGRRDDPRPGRRVGQGRAPRPGRRATGTPRRRRTGSWSWSRRPPRAPPPRGGQGRPAPRRWRAARRPGWSRTTRGSRRTAKLSTSSIRTTTCGRRRGQLGDDVTQQPGDVPLALAEHLARHGVRVDLEERRRAARRHGERRRLGEARGASVVLPVPGGPASTMSPLGGAGSAARRRPCIIATSAVPSSRSLVPAGTTMLSHGPSWWPAGSTCTDATPGGSDCVLTARSAWSAPASRPCRGRRPACP